jgi:histidine triad (HIT) family protein
VSRDACIFCKIRDREIPATLLHEDEHCLAFRDRNPQAPHHILIIPRKHIATLNDLDPEDGATLGAMVLAARHLAKKEGIADAGWRTVMNVGEHGGQSVFHVHMHLLGGRALGWPPG